MISQSAAVVKRPSPLLSARSRTAALVAGTTIVAAVLRLHWLTHKSLWIDEAVSVTLAQASWADFWGEVSIYEGNMILYYLLLRTWIHLGQGEFALRSLSVLFGVAAIPAIYFLGRRLFGRETALCSAALLALHAAPIQFSQEARSYSLVLLLLILSTYFFARAAEEAGTARSVWLGYSICSVLAVYAHVLAALVLVAQWISLRSPRLRQLPRRTVLWVWVALGALLSPMGAFVLFRNRGQINWIPQPTVSGVGYALGFLTGGGVILLFFAYLAACTFAVSDRRLAAPAPRSRFAIRLVVAWAVFPIAIMLAFSLLGRPLLSYRYVGMCVPAVVLLAAYGLTRLPSEGRIKTVATAALLALSLLGANSYFRSFGRAGHDWRSVTRYLMDEYQSEDAVFFYIPAGYRAFAYYAKQQIAARASGAWPVVVYPVAHSVVTQDAAPTPQEIDMLTKPYRRLWLVLHHADAGRPRTPFASLIPPSLGCQTEQEFPGKWPDGITVMLCGPRDARPPEFAQHTSAAESRAFRQHRRRQ